MATPLTHGLRALRISRATTLRLCQPRTAALLTRQLSTSLPRFTSVAAAEPVPVLEVLDSDASKPVPPSKVVAEEGDETTEVEGMPFVHLKDKISFDTLKAITFRPMRHQRLTPVQQVVLPMLPDLVRPLTKKPDGTFVDPKVTRDLMVRAKTGTGKTLAFLVPAIEARAKEIERAGKEAKVLAGEAAHQKLIVDAEKEYARTHVGAIILSPTRELAKQIAVEAEKLCTYHKFVVHQFLGGESKYKQIRFWKENRKDIVVATTGRLRDLMDSEPELMEPLRAAKFLILDEADTMLDIGFRPDIEYITSQLPQAPERQTFIFSATISKAVQQIARQTMCSKNSLFINTVNESDSPVHAHIPQYHTVLSSAKDQLPHILRLLAHDQLTNPGKSKVMIFLPTTKLTQLYSTLIRELSRAVLPARNTMLYELHSKKSMESRTRTSDRFRHDNSGACVLVTSDVSARGVDYPGVTRVIQLGIPSSSDQYVHRIGRTGRQGSTQGRADLVLLPWEHGYIRDQLSEIPLKPVTSNDFEQHVHEIAEQHDSNPKAFVEKAGLPQQERTEERGRYRRGPLFTTRVSERLKAVKEEIDEVLSSVIEEEEVNETFASLCGYYVSRNDELRIPRNAILEGLRDWAVHAGGLPEAPHVSESFLYKLGFMSDRTRSSGGYSRGTGRGGFEKREDRWSGRGNWRTKVAKKQEKKRLERGGEERGSRGRRWSDDGDGSRGRRWSNDGDGSRYGRREDQDRDSYRGRSRGRDWDGDRDSDRRRPSWKKTTENSATPF